MDLFVGVKVEADMTTTDMFNQYPDTVIGMVSILTGDTIEKVTALPTFEIIGKFEILNTLLDFGAPRAVPFIQIGETTYTAAEPLLANMAADTIQYGNSTFGCVLEALALLETATYKHRALPMLVAHLYDCEPNKTVAKKAKELLNMQANEASYICFFLSSLGIGYGIRTLNQLAVSTEVRTQ
jgi:hypothetical protein